MSPVPGGGSSAGIGRELRIFISSATGALEPYRQAAVDVCHRLGHRPVFMENFDPQRPPPDHVCRAQVEGCDVLVLLLAHRYGSKPPGQDVSYTELEYRWAASRADIQLFCFVVDPDCPWPPRDIDQGPDAVALAQLIAEVKVSHLVRPLADIAVFREDLMAALSREQLAVPAAAPVATTADTDAEETYTVPQPPTFHAVPAYMGSAPFTGRSSHLAELDRWGQSADPVLVVEAIGGTGKSALTWQWAQDRAPVVVDGLAGRLWWSFYDGSASMTRFLRELLAYTTGRPMKQIRQLERSSLADQVLTELRRRPYLVVLDGFERLLSAYHQFDPSKLRDEDVEPDKRSMIEPNADEIVRRLVTAAPSKVLISTRLMPLALNSRFGMPMPGVRHVRLPGLSDADTRMLLDRLGVTGSEAAITRFFGPLGNHPLLVGMVAGMVRDYRAEPGRFDRWLADPTAGGVLSVPGLDLTQRRTHILAAALAGLSPGSLRLLGWISVLPGLVAWDTLTAINPFRPEPPAPAEPDFTVLGARPSGFDYLVGQSDSEWPRPVNYEPPWGDRTSRGTAGGMDEYRLRLEEWDAAADDIRSRAEQVHRAQLDAWSGSEPVKHAQALLAAALQDLEDRGLLWWDRSSNYYDLHPIIRAYAHERLGDTDRVQANDRVRDHFQSLPPEDAGRAVSVEDLTITITIFRALVGADHLDEAAKLWEKFGNSLQVSIGAYSTIVELLSPLATRGSIRLRGFLAAAYGYMGLLDEAMSQEIKMLADELADEAVSVGTIRVMLGRLSDRYRTLSAFIASENCMGLRDDLAAADGAGPDANVILGRAFNAAIHGQVERARTLLDTAQSLVPPDDSPWFEDDLDRLGLYLALHADRSLTQGEISAALAPARSWLFRRDVTAWRCSLYIRDGQFTQALAVAEQHDKLGRDAGLEMAPAVTAFLLARLGQPAQASAAVEDALIRLPRLHPAKRPHYYLARALHELDRHAEAAEHARQAYRRAWAEGPPHHRHWELQDARELLLSMNEPEPDLPVVDLTGVTIPFEDEIRALIATIAAQRQADDETEF